jgi:hypothetical protein
VPEKSGVGTERTGGNVRKTPRCWRFSLELDLKGDRLGDLKTVAGKGWRKNVRIHRLEGR